MKRFLTVIGISLYCLLLVVVSAKLFFETQFNALIDSVFYRVSVETREFTIGVSDTILRHDPRANDVGSRMWSQQIFEPLIRHTPTLELESALALSYGQLNPTTWEVRLRPNVFFHDGSTLTAQDVVTALKISREQNSDVADLLSTVSSVEAGDLKVVIHTKSPDVLLPHKLASVLIFKPAVPVKIENPSVPPIEYSEAQPDGNFIGTGPYTGSSNNLTLFKNYWGTLPAASALHLVELTTKQAKVDALKNKSVDVLMNPPADVASEFNFPEYTMVVRPGLEADMLFMKPEGPLADISMRKALQAAVTPNTLVRFAHGFATVINQLSSPEIFGYNPDISFAQGDSAAARKLVPLKPSPIALDLPLGLEALGKTIQKQLADVGLTLDITYNSGPELNKKIVQQKSQFYFFGWKHDLGDTLPFLAAVIHSRSGGFGEFNGMNYKNPQVDSLIEKALQTADSATRRDLQRQIMKIIVVDDAIAIPLFAPDVLYAVRENTNFVPRIDGYIVLQ